MESLEGLLATELSQPSAPSTVWTAQVRRLISAVREAELTHKGTIAQSATLLKSQADALTRSEQIIEELRRTRNELSEARRAAKRHESERLRLLAGVFENAQEGVVVLDACACIHEVNPVFREIAQRPASELVGRPLASVMEWAFPESDEVLRNVMAGNAWTGRVVVARGEQSERTYLLSFSPVQSDGQLTNVVAIFSDVTDIDRTQRRLKRMALHDQLTGLPNRRYYRERVRSLIERSRRDGSSFALCFIDLDGFKHVNDSLGHNAGDDLLIEVARRLRRVAGEEAFVARFGGDEFAMVLPRTDRDLQKTATVADRVLQAIREPIAVADTEACIGASLGVTECPTHSVDLDELLQNADVAMYAAKHRGRNQVCVFSNAMRRHVKKRHQIQNELQRALRGNEISLRYQPQVDLRTGRVTGCEALARWQTPDGRDIAPGQFFPVAEQSGLVIPLGELVLMSACRQLCEWHALGSRPPRVSINISPQHLHYHAFVDRVAEILVEVGARPEWLMLEITENAVMDDVRHAMQTMDALVDMGLTLAIDDFGTGQSPLSHLKRFNIHSLKVDRSFVADLPHDQRARSIIESIILLGQGRQLQVIAEGIETQEQFDLLREMGCDVGQGFHIARPLRPTALEGWWDELPSGNESQPNTNCDGHTVNGAAGTTQHSPAAET